MASSSPDDWACPNESCINSARMVFGSKDSCPKCGASKFGDGSDGAKTTAGMQGGDMPDDWSCPNTDCINHTKMVFGKRSSCPSCGTARNAKQPGDWLCPNTGCQNHRNCVFASKASCPKCGCPRPEVRNPKGLSKGGGGGPPIGGGMPMMGSPLPPMMLGGPGGNQGDDWSCPNVTCINHVKMVFGRHGSCPKCGSPKQGIGGFGGPGAFLGGGGGGGVVMPGGPGGPGGDRGDDWSCPNVTCMNHSKMVFGRHSSCPKCGSPKTTVGYFGGSGGSPGPKPQNDDWSCPNMTCINHSKMVFGRHSSCPKCGSPKPGVGGFGGCGGFAASGPKIQSDDWSCPNATCINHSKMVFARHSSCPKCGSPKPAMGSFNGFNGGGYAGVSGGPISPVGRPDDWQCPNPDCVNNQRMVFGKHQTCPRCGAEQPMGGAYGMHGVGSTNGAGGVTLPKHRREGDWQCPSPDCMNHLKMVFGKNDNCPQCGAPKPSRADDRSRSPPMRGLAAAF